MKPSENWSRADPGSQFVHRIGQQRARLQRTKDVPSQAILPSQMITPCLVLKATAETIRYGLESPDDPDTSKLDYNQDRAASIDDLGGNVPGDDLSFPDRGHGPDAGQGSADTTTADASKNDHEVEQHAIIGDKETNRSVSADAHDDAVAHDMAGSSMDVKTSDVAVKPEDGDTDPKISEQGGVALIEAMGQGQTKPGKLVSTEYADTDKNNNNGDGYGPLIGLIDWHERHGDGTEFKAINRIENGHQALDTARSYIANAFGAEALAALDYFDRRASELPDETQYRLVEKSLRAAANFLMDRRQAAKVAFASLGSQTTSNEDSSPYANAVDVNSELILWQVAMDTAEQQWNLDRDTALSIVDTIRDYPPKLQVRLGLAAAVNALESGFADPAYVVLNMLEGLELNPQEKWQLSRIAAMVLERDGAIEAALNTMQELIDNAEGLTSLVDARYERTLMKHRADMLDTDEAIDELGEQQLLWRGHEREPLMMNVLGDFLIQDNQLVAGLDVWENAIKRDVYGDYGQQILKKIDNLVSTNLSGDFVDEESLAALMLFNRYGDTITDKKTYDEIVERLAVGLAIDGFPDVAAALLDENRGFVLGGGSSPTRVSVAKKQLEAGNPEAVFSTLPYDETARPVEAKARLALGETDAARSLLVGQQDINSIIGLIDSHWIDRDLTRLSAFGSMLVQQRDLDEAPPSELNRAVLRIASAKLAKNQIDDLRDFLKSVKEREEITLDPAWNVIMYGDSLKSGETDTLIADLGEILPEIQRDLEKLTAVTN